VAYLLAVLAALANALSAIFQRIGVQNAPADTVMSLRLIRHAFSNAIWFLGLAMIAVGFLLQAGALHFGQLSSVQPIVTAELLFVVLILGGWFRYHLGWQEWGGSIAAVGGLAGFLVIADPGGGTADPSGHAWIVVFVLIGAASAGCAALGFTGPRWFRAAMFGAAGAVLFALSAAITKQLTTLLSSGWSHVFTSWVPYTLVATGVLGLFLIQSSFQAGPITASQSAITIIDPIVSVVIGIYLFHDRLDTAGWRLPAEAVAVVLLVAGIYVLSTSPLVAGAKDESGKGDKLVRQDRRQAAGGPVATTDAAET
jgi:drug/metabolite transporter (DMT)-like permease